MPVNTKPVGTSLAVNAFNRLLYSQEQALQFPHASGTLKLLNAMQRLT